MKNSGAHARRITVNGRFLSQPITGVQRYAEELLSSLDALLTAGAVEPVPVTVIAPPNAIRSPAWQSIRMRTAGRLTGQLWEQIDLPVQARGTLLFTPCGGAPVVHTPHVITIHDAGPFSTPGAYTAGYRSYYKSLQKVLTRTARHVITVSDFSREELMRQLGIPAAHISRTWESGEHVLRWERDDTVLQRHGLARGRFVLAVGSRNPNKNIDVLVQAMEVLDDPSVYLALAGGSAPSIFGRAAADAAPGKRHVRQLGFVNDAELRSLYENAGCFVFPSLYEGFGLPPLEALTLGCPVIVARAASLPEIFGQTATYCDPHSPENIARQISKVLAGDHPAREAALSHAAAFTWKKCARETWALLLNACKSRGTRS